MSKMYENLLDHISVTALRRLVSVLLVGFALLGCLAFNHNWVGGGSDQPRFGGHEVAEWHFLPDGQVRVHSRITLTRSPANATGMRIELPYESGRIESASLDGRPISWVEIPPGLECEPGLYVSLNTPGPALRESVTEVVWTFPFEDVPWLEEEECYRIRLCALIPVKSLSVVGILEEGCGLEMRDFPELRYTQPFGGTFGRAYNRDIGTCGLLLRPVAEG